MLYQIWEGAPRCWLIDLGTNTPARGIVSKPTPQVTEADKEPGPGTSLFAVIVIMCESLADTCSSTEGDYFW